MPKFQFIIVVLLFLFTAACASIPERRALFPGIENAQLDISDELLAQVKSLKRCPEKIKVIGSLTAEKKPQFEPRQVKFVMIATPGHLRANGLGPLGIKAFDLAYRPTLFTADIPLKKITYQAGKELRSWSRKELGLNPEDFYLLFCPLKDAAATYFTTLDVDKSRVLYLYHRSLPYLKLRHVLEFDQEQQQVQKIQFMPGNKGKLMVYTQDFRNTDGFWLPHVIRWEHPDSNFKAVLEVEDYEIPQRVPANVFTLKPAADRDVRALLDLQ